MLSGKLYKKSRKAPCLLAITIVGKNNSNFKLYIDENQDLQKID